jgi:hypothetical protein
MFAGKVRPLRAARISTYRDRPEIFRVYSLSLPLQKVDFRPLPACGGMAVAIVIIVIIANTP